MADVRHGYAFLVVVVLCGFLGCGGSESASDGGAEQMGGSSDAESAAGGSAGSPLEGGAVTGGTATGGAATGATSGTGAAASGGTRGGEFSAGGSAGTLTTGGRETGGAAAGGMGTGGAADGTGGMTTGGAAGETGGMATGGMGTGGAAAGGMGTGGAADGTGGMATGGEGGIPSEAHLELDPSTSMDYDAIVLGTTAVATYTVTNRGASTSGIPSISTDFGAVPPGEPNPVIVSGCSDALPPNGSCELTISVTPPELGLLDGFVRITADPATYEHDAPRLSIYVAGWAIGYEVSSPSAFDLGDVPSGIPIERSATITALIALSDLTVWTNSENVAVNESATTCTQTLAAGASCELTIEFLAPSVGWKSDWVGIRAGGDTGQLAGLQFTANVTNANDLALDPNSPQTFVAYYEETTDPIVFTVTNVSETISGTITSTIVAEEGPSDFSIVDSDCTTLAPNETCTISVVCSPQMSASAARREALLSINDGNTHVAVPLMAEVS